jgi:ATP-dependent helicase HrpB
LIFLGRFQQIFGCFETPKILGVPLLLKLLSPASRPLQITDDLEHFWTGAWIDICREMKGRYPKHKWDYRISEKD